MTTGLSHLEIVRGLFSEWNEHRRDLTDRFFAPDLVLDTRGLPQPDFQGVYHGRAGFAAWARTWLSAWEDAQQHPVWIEENGDRVIAWVQLHLVGKSSGIGGDPYGGWAFTFGDGRIVEIRLIADETEALFDRLASDPGAAFEIMRAPRSEAERTVTRALIHGGYAAFNHGSLDEAFGGLPADVEWEFMPEVIDFGTLRGRDAIQHAFVRLLDEFEYQSNIEDYDDDGERISMRIHGTFLTRHTGLAMEVLFIQTWDYEDGHLMIRERLLESRVGRPAT